MSIHGQKGVDGGSKRETEVRLDGWCEGDLGQYRNDGGATMKILKGCRALVRM